MSNTGRIAQVSLSSARACLVKKNYGRAFANFLLFLKLAPRRCDEVRNEFSVAMREWSETLERDGKINDLFKCYDQACELFPNHDVILNNIGAQLFRLGYTEEAAAYIRRALLINPDYLAARENLENICSHLVERWHFRMLNDVKRNNVYKEAIRRAINKGYDSVLDIGAGTGILSLIACDVGASVVYACEKSHAMYEVARDVLQANSADDRVLLLHHSSTDLSVPDYLPERVSLVITETFDAGLFGEHIISTLTHAWRNLLTNIPSMMGSVIPCAATMYVCGIESESLRKQNRLLYPMLQNLDLSGVDIVCTTGLVAEEPYTTENLARLPGGYKMLTNVSELLRVNFCNPQELEFLQLGKDWIANLIVKQHGHLDALAVWFDLHLDECVTITTAPDTENCWEQAVYPVLSVSREKDTGQEICYLNKKEKLQVTFHFEHDCLRLSGCAVNVDDCDKSADKMNKQLDDHDHVSNSKTDDINKHLSDLRSDSKSKSNSSILPLRKRKIRKSFISSETSSFEDLDENSSSSSNTIAMLQSEDCEAGGGVVEQTYVGEQNVIAIATDEYLLQQCGNLTLNNGNSACADSGLVSDLTTLHSQSDLQCHSGDSVDEFNLSSNDSKSIDILVHEDSRITENPSTSHSPINSSINSLLSDDNEHKQSIFKCDNSESTHKQLVEYSVESDDDCETERSIGDSSWKNGKHCDNLRKQSSLSDGLVESIDMYSTDPLFSKPDSSHMPEATAESNNHCSSVTNMKPIISIPIDNLEIINEERIIYEDSKDSVTTSKDTIHVKRPTDKYTCLAEHSDILYLNDIHLNRAYVKALEQLMKGNESAQPLSVLYNTTRLSFSALQARSLNYSPVTMVTSEEHHGTFQAVMAANHLRPGEVTLLDLSELDGDEGKYDVVLFDLVEPCGALRQQVLEDIALIRMTSLSEAGRIVPGKVTIHGLFIESQELEIMNHVTGNDKTLGYSIADFINVFQLRNHINIDLGTLQHTKLTEVFQLFQLDMNQSNNSKSLQCLQQVNRTIVKVLESGTITALVYWFELQLLDNLKVSTLDPRTHWKQAGIMMKDEVCVETDQCVVATMTLQNSCLDVTVKSSLPVNCSSSVTGLL